MKAEKKIKRAKRASRKDDRKSFLTVQAKTLVNEPNDSHEVEADKMADRVVANTSNDSHPTAKSTIGHFSTAPAIQKASSQEENVPVQSKHDGIPSAKAVSVSGIKSGSGKPMDQPTRQAMEDGFGTDFSDVRIHTDSHAQTMSDQLSAQAFTHENDVFFNKGKYNPASKEGKHLLAHELTHTIQQKGMVQKKVQRSFSIEPTSPDREPKDLTENQIKSAIAFNKKRHKDLVEVKLIRDILGISPEPAVIDADFVRAVVNYQAVYNLTMDGKIGGTTADRIAREIISESAFLGKGNGGDLETEFSLQTTLSTLIKANNVNYADYKSAILSSTMIQGYIVLHNKKLLKDLKAKLTWKEFAKCIELLGYSAPSYRQLISNSVVKKAMKGAWTDSDVAVPIAGVTTQHEEGGWVYLNLISGTLTTGRAARGAGAAINLSAPPIVADSVVVAKFHTHPNLGPLWDPTPSPQDISIDAIHGVPDIVIGNPGVDVNKYQFYQSGPDKRLHLSGNQGLPGAAGGLAPQGKKDGSFDQQ